MSSAQPSQKRSPSGSAPRDPSGDSRPQAQPVAPPPRRGRPRESWVAQLSGVLKLASALFALAAAVLFIQPLFKGDLEKKEEPHLITLKPTASPSPEPAPEPRPTEATARPKPPQPQTPPAEPEASAEPPPSAPAGVQENRTAFTGALLMIDSQPSGAIVRVNGVNQGETPVTVGLDCTPGTTLNVSFALRGFENLVHHTTCPKDALVKVTAQLHPGSSKPTGKAPGKRRASP